MTVEMVLHGGGEYVIGVIVDSGGGGGVVCEWLW